MISLICAKETNERDQRKKSDFGYQGLGTGRGNWRNMVRRYKLPVLTHISARDVMYMITIANTAI